MLVDFTNRLLFALLRVDALPKDSSAGAASTNFWRIRCATEDEDEDDEPFDLCCGSAPRRTRGTHRSKRATSASTAPPPLLLYSSPFLRTRVELKKSPSRRIDPTAATSERTIVEATVLPEPEQPVTTTATRSIHSSIEADDDPSDIIPPPSASSPPPPLFWESKRAIARRASALGPGTSTSKAFAALDEFKRVGSGWRAAAVVVAVVVEVVPLELPLFPPGARAAITAALPTETSGTGR